MASRTPTDFWRRVERIGGRSIRPGERKAIQALYGWLVIEAALSRWVEYLQGEEGGASAFRTLCNQVQAGIQERHTEYAEQIETAPLLRTSDVILRRPLTPVGFVDDPLLAKMPPLIQCIVESRLENTGICSDFAIAGAIAMVTAACGNRLRFRAWGDEHYTNLYLVLVGETGKSFKSSVLKRVKADLSAVDPRLLAADEGSIEALIKDMAESPSRLWIRDEFAGLLASIKGVDYLKPVRELLLSLYDHSGVYRRRLTKGEWTCTNPALSFLATIQPAVMGEELFSGRNVDSGFVNRLLLIPGAGVEPYWPVVADYEVLRNDITERLRHLSTQPVTMTEATHLQAAAQVWDGVERTEFGEYGPYVAKRAALQALKLATILEAASEWPGRKNIESRWLSVALELLERWYKLSVKVIADVHIKQPGERDRRDFFVLACHAAHNQRGPQTIGILSSEAQISKRKAEEYVIDLQSRGWLSKDDDERYHCTRLSSLCEKVAK